MDFNNSVKCLTNIEKGFSLAERIIKHSKDIYEILNKDSSGSDDDLELLKEEDKNFAQDYKEIEKLDREIDSLNNKINSDLKKLAKRKNKTNHNGELLAQHSS